MSTTPPAEPGTVTVPVPALTRFLLTRIAEDEAAARDAILERHRVLGTVRGSVPGMTLRSWPDAGVPAVLVGPERVLAECEGKRRIVDEHSATRDYVYRDDDSSRACGVCGDGTVEAPCRTLIALAQPYADHEDFQEAWRL